MTESTPSGNERFPTPLDSIPLLTMNREGEVPPSRLKNASSARTIYVRFRDDDLPNARNRALMLDQLGGGPPWDQSVLDNEGMNDTTNLNFGGSEQQLERAMAPFYALVQSPENLVSVSTNFGPLEDRDDLNSILSEEISRTIRSWSGFTFNTAKITHHFVWDGVAFANFPDDTDWRYSGSGLGEYFVPRQTFPSEDTLEVVVRRDTYTVTQLYRSIANPDLACDLGWNVEATKIAIQKAAPKTPNFYDWELMEDQIKNNDLWIANTCSTISVLSFLIREFDGTISHYLTTEDDQGTEEFMYCSRQKYREMSEQLVIFTYGIGVNCKTHGIRGLGYKIWAFEEQRNRSLSRMIDQGTLASSIMLQATDEETMGNAALTYIGNQAIIDPTFKAVPFNIPNLEQTTMPVLAEMERLRNDRVSSYSSENVFDGDQRKTKFEVGAALQQNASLSSVSLDFWYSPYERLIRQSVRRMSRPSYVPGEPGGREVADLRLRLLKRGVPPEALYLIDHQATKVVKAIGSGSASAKTLSLQRVSDLRPAMDDVGQQKLNRDLAIDAVGVAKANEYFPPNGEKRISPEYGIAILQNYELLRGNEVPVLPTDRHVVQAEAHFKPLMESFDAVEKGQAPIEQIAQQMQLLFSHTADHVERIDGDPATQAKAAEFRQILQQVGEVISNGLRKAQAQAIKAQEEGGQPGQPGQPEDQSSEGQPPPDAEQIAKFEKHKAEMQMAREKHDQKMQELLQESALKRGIKDAEAAAQIALNAKKNQP
jgi:hypothetical protein